MIVVEKDLCIGCGSCVALDEDVFDFQDGLAYCKNPNAKVNDNVKTAIENCPTDAIKIIK
ncbi:MAG: ferredoxin [bacterium]|nr:ferredoxin [bacterium]